MKSIVVPTDFSDHALYALKVAACIAKKIEAEINLVHVYNLPSSGFELNYYYEKFYKEINSNANNQLDKLVKKKFLKDLTVNKHLITEMLMWEIANTEQFKDTELIVMGSHGKSGFNRVFIGSNTEKLVRLADVPVLTIKNELVDFRINNMVFASNFLEESYSVFEKIKFFADIYNAHIDLLKVITPKDFEETSKSQQLINDFAYHFSLKNYTVNIINAYNIEDGIIDFSHEKNADLIAIETHGRTGFSHLINGSLAEDLVKHESKPVLSIKIQNVSEFGKSIMNKTLEYENWGEG